MPTIPTDEQAIALLTDLVAIPSPSHHEREAVECCVRWMRDLGYQAEIDAAGNAVGVLGSGPRQIVLLGHIDTAPGNPPSHREGDLLYGRGAVDAKGPLAAFVVAGSRAAGSCAAAAHDIEAHDVEAHDVGAHPRVRPLAPPQIVVIGAVEEECATSAGARHALTQYRPDYCVIGEPSGWERITLGYKGRLLIDYVLERPVSHTAGQERGACEEAIDYWLGITRWADEFNRDKEGRFATLDPSLREIQSTSDGLTERVEMTIALRLPPGLDVEQIRNRVSDRQYSGANSVSSSVSSPIASITTRAYEQPFRADKRTPLVSAFLASIRSAGICGAADGKAALVTKTGTSDMNVVGPVWGCPILAYGPGDSQLDHTPHEHLSLPEYLASIRVLTAVLQRLGDSDPLSAPGEGQG